MIRCIHRWLVCSYNRMWWSILQRNVQPVHMAGIYHSNYTCLVSQSGFFCVSIFSIIPDRIQTQSCYLCLLDRFWTTHIDWDSRAYNCVCQWIATHCQISIMCCKHGKSKLCQRIQISRLCICRHYFGLKNVSGSKNNFFVCKGKPQNFVNYNKWPLFDQWHGRQFQLRLLLL